MAREFEPCEHSWTGRVSYPRFGDQSSEAHASTYCCDRKECISDAAHWVRSVTGHVGEYVGMPKLKTSLHKFREGKS